jgi:hypothetical protein
VSRSIEQTPDALVVNYTGLYRLLCLRHRVTVPYRSIGSVAVGGIEVPGTFARRTGLSWGFFNNTRRGTFWSGGRRMFLDFADPARAVVLELTGERDDVVAIEPNESPEELAAALRERAALDQN